jgi:uncharacterized protein (TIGR02246 family)
MTDEQQIRTLIERWAAAVHAGDLGGVLADHAADIVMFDVPPPYEGVRGIDAYRAAWPPFFAWQAGGAMLEIESLDVTAGADVAYAHALLRCGTPEDLAERPANRLRLTLGLRRERGRWVVAHEHHSFPDAPAKTHIAGGATLIVPVSDQDRAVGFYTSALGFAKRVDFTYAGGERWVEVAPPGGTTQLALVVPRDGARPGVETRVAFASADLEADHARLKAQGADVDDAILREGDPPVSWGGTMLAGIPPMFLVRDPDGNSLLIVQGG